MRLKYNITNISELPITCCIYLSLPISRIPISLGLGWRPLSSSNGGELVIESCCSKYSTQLLSNRAVTVRYSLRACLKIFAGSMFLICQEEGCRMYTLCKFTFYDLASLHCGRFKFEEWY